MLLMHRVFFRMLLERENDMFFAKREFPSIEPLKTDGPLSKVFNKHYRTVCWQKKGDYYKALGQSLIFLDYKQFQPSSVQTNQTYSIQSIILL